jgi:hypothetical protein
MPFWSVLEVSWSAFEASWRVLEATWNVFRRVSGSIRYQCKLPSNNLCRKQDEIRKRWMPLRFLKPNGVRLCVCESWSRRGALCGTRSLFSYCLYVADRVGSRTRGTQQKVVAGSLQVQCMGCTFVYLIEILI